MNATRPYLIRAFYDWISDNDCTPHILVNANMPSVEVPTEYIEDGQIVLNIAMTAVHGLELGNTAISFQARFGGIPRDLYIPVQAVTAIYARENGRGMVFSDEDDHDPDTVTDFDATNTDKEKGKRGGGKKGSHLTVVK